MGQPDDRRWMLRALREGQKGRPSPNPHVGAVVVRDGELVSVGHHPRAGEAHAEVVAMRRAGERARGATLYVTLEPCNHRGRTGPCTEAILAAGVSRVVIGCLDPAPHGAPGTNRLRASGVEVEVGVCEPEARALVADFAKHFNRGLPFVTLKAAVTLDGKMATRTGDSKWITGESARREAHRMRAQADAVMVGVGTVLADDPRLDVRHVRGGDPLRVVLDTHLRTPPSAAMLHLDSKSPTLIFHGPDAPAARRAALSLPGVELLVVELTDGRVDLERALRALARRDVVRLLVEGGARVHGALLDAGLADRAAVFVAPRIVGDAGAPSFCAGRGVDSIGDAYRLHEVRTRRLGSDTLIEGSLARGGDDRP